MLRTTIVEATVPTLLAKLLRLSNGTNKTVVILIHSVVSRYIFSVLFLFKYYSHVLFVLWNIYFFFCSQIFF